MNATALETACLTGLLVLIVVQAGMVARFARLCAAGGGRAADRPPATGHARVVLCLRGSDPFLGATLRAAVEQDHPDYELRVVVDSTADPAWEETQRVIAAARPRCRVSVEPLRRPSPVASSLKCASVLQGLRDLDPATRVVALLDADVVPPRHWLRTLAEAVAGDGCGVATGNRWYQPPDDAWGSWTRAAWNGGALVQMVCFGIPWGGTLALRSELLETAGLREKWARAFCEDTLLAAAVGDVGERVVFVPSLIAVNRESVTLASLLPWIARQLLTARLYHPAWLPVAAFGLSVPVVLAGTGVAAALAWQRGDWAGIGRLAATTAAFVAALPALLAWIESIVRRAVPAPFATDGRRLIDRLPLMAAGAVLAQIVYVVALLQASVARSSRWRGVTYSIVGPWRIRLVDDRAPEPAGGGSRPKPLRALQSL
jgi:hypothetical protein